jgi:LacI family transcriptional regulator
MIEVAQRAGVSTATVSRVLAGPPEMVRPETREKVLRAVAETGYLPNRLARNLRERAARIFAVVVSDIGNPFFTALVRSCEDAARERGYSVLVADTDEKVDQEAQRLLDVAAEGVAGIILASTGRQNEGLEQVVRSWIPVVAVDRRVATASFDTVATDGRAGAREGIEALLEAGHQRIALIGGPEEISTMTERRVGYEEALRGHDIEPEPDLIRFGDLKEESGRAAALELLDLATPPTAIFTASNLIAIGAVKALRERRLRLPDDLSLVCFDDVIGGELIGPGIAAVVQPTYEMGTAAAELLIRRLEDPEAAVEERVLPTALLRRGSIGPPPDGSSRRPG